MLVPTVTDRIDAALIGQAGEQLKLIANFGNGVDNIDVTTAVAARHHRHQHAGRPHRGHRRYDDGADPRRAAPPRRGRAGDPRRGMDRMVADLDARASHRGQAARHRRHGPHRPGRGAARAARSACRSTITTAAGSPPQIEEELDATYWESLDQMLARMDIISVNCPHTPGDLSSALGAAAEADLARTPIIVNTARGEVIDEDTR